MLFPINASDSINFGSKISRLKKRQSKQLNLEITGIKRPKSSKEDVCFNKASNTLNANAEFTKFNNINELKKYLIESGYKLYEPFLDAFNINPQGVNVYLDACRNSCRHYEYSLWEHNSRINQKGKKINSKNGGDLNPALLDAYSKYPIGAKYLLSKTYIKNDDPIFYRDSAAFPKYIGDELLEYMPICNSLEDIKIFENFNSDKDISQKINYYSDAPASLYKAYKENPIKFKEFAQIYRGNGNIAPLLYDSYLKEEESALNLLDKYELLDKISYALEDNPQNSDKYLNLISDLIKEKESDIEKLVTLANPRNNPYIGSADEFIEILNAKKQNPEILDTLLDSNIRCIGNLSSEDIISLIKNYGNKIKPLSKFSTFSLSEIKEIIDIVNS